MPDQIGPAFLITLSSIFGGYGVGELVAASRVEPLNEWAEKAMIGSGGVALGALFVAMALRAITPA